MKKYIAQAALGFFISLITTLVFPLCGQTTDTLKNSPQVSQLRAELLQMQQRYATTKAKADSLLRLVQAKEIIPVLGMGQEYWLDVIKNNRDEEFIADLVQDKLIKKESALRSYHLDMEIFRVNGQKQSPETAKRYQEKYLSRKPNGDHTTSITHTVGGFLGIKR